MISFRPFLSLLLAFATLGTTLLAEAPSPGNASTATATARAQLRTIYEGLREYMQVNHGAWPQCPPKLSAEETRKWWIKTLLPHDVKEQDWINPKTANDPLSKDRLSYIPSAFDGLPNTAYKWPNQPWVIEVGFEDMDQLLVLMPDGRVITQKELFDINRNPPTTDPDKK